MPILQFGAQRFAAGAARDRRARRSFGSGSPETPEQTANAFPRFSFSFYLLSDRGNALARKVGLVYRLPPEMQSELQKANIYLPAINGDDSWELPVPATYLVGQEGVIRDAFVDVDYNHRKDPRELITELKKISS